jgi:DNA-binding transcriptional LysR family regulator
MLDPVLLKTFLAVEETRSFTRAAERLKLRQSTVSQHIRKLEAATSRQLFLRDTHSVRLTGDGEAMIGFARGIVDAIDRAMTYFTEPELRGEVRFGVSEDFVLGGLPEILRRFRTSHPLVEVKLTVELSGILHEQLRAGELDLMLAKRIDGDDEPGYPLWTDRLVWACVEGLELDAGLPVPLITYPPPSVTRARAVEALRVAGREWRLACTSGSLNGLRAAALAGLGVVVFARTLLPAGLVEVPREFGLPDPGEVEFMLTGGDSAPQEPAAALAGAITTAAGRLKSAR